MVGSLHKDVPGLDRGTVVGRYVVLDVIGQGGMGVVYAAYDPELDRKVAIKLLQAGADGSGSSSAGSQTWLVREAQAMARLSHPNVVAVHDVGVVGDRVFIAMELVAGTTLRTWIKAERRTWQDVIAVMRAAGEGLVAAHAVGLVHRDFKPENVIVGEDGRVRVMDFGLARLRSVDEPVTPASRASDVSIDARSPLSESLTEAGTVMGTPAYMAPEVHDGLGANAKSDQFAFGATLYEALYRMRPYDKADLRATRTRPPVPRTPPESNVPVRVHRVVMRAIDPDPAARFPTMKELLAELAIDPFARRRRVAIGAGIGVLVAAAGAGALLLSRRAAGPGELCKGTERALVGVWDPPIVQHVHAAFTATKKPYAEQAFTGLAHALDHYAGEWTAATVGNCEATRIRGEQTEKVQTIRQLCLDQRLEGIRSLAQVLQDPTDALVEKADKAVWELEPIAGCASAAAIVEPAVASRDQPEYARLLLKVAGAHGQAIGGQYLPALTALAQAAEAGAKIKADDVVAIAQLARGVVLFGIGNSDEGYAAEDQAVWSAMRAKRDDLAASAALTIAGARAEAASLEVADVWLKLANASAARAGGFLPVLDERRLEITGVIAAQRGDFVTAVAEHEKALEAAKALWGANNPALWGAENQLATTLGRAGAWVKSIPHLEHALALRESSVGPDHPDVALVLSNLAAGYEHAGETAKALASAQRALAIREKTYGPNSPFLVATLNNLADLEQHHGELAAAFTDIERAKAIAVRIPGTANPIYHVIATTEAEILGARGKLAESRAAFDEVIALEDKLKSPELGTTLASRAALELSDHKWAAAAQLEERSIACYEASGGPEHLSLWKPLAGLAQARRGLDPKADVKPLLDRAMATAVKAQLGAEELDPIRDALAKL
ncbi:MAG TPA: serine/threonine-protein kinase [Kofleriaceae bacterium]